MTDAREIIAQEFRLAHRDTCYPDASAGECEIAASVIVSSLNAAGFRILGPDEVDQVTLEKAADVAEKEAENERLRKALEAATGLLRRVPGALNSEFSAGMEEREGGSANRQEKLLQASEALRRDIDAFIARRALEGDE